MPELSDLPSFSLFSPTIIRGLGFATWRSQLMSSPPYVLAFFVAVGVAFGSWKTHRRAPWIIGADVIILVGYALLVGDTRPGPSYVGLFFVISGIYSATALTLSWPSENVSGHTKRAIALGMQISIGNCGAITSTLIYRPTPASFPANHYRKPHIITMGYIVGAMIVAAFLWFFLAKANARRDALQAKASEAGLEKPGASVATEQERLVQGDRHVSFRYRL